MKPFYESSDYTNFSKILLSKHGISSIDNHNNQINNLKVNRSDSRKLQSIFRSYWFKLKPLILDRLRPAIISNVESMINCHNLYYGYLFYECNKCDKYHITGISCHSRFCPSCNNKYRAARTLSMQKKLLAVKHRHFVFSIPKEFRKYFRYHRALLNVLFRAVHDSFTHLIQNSKKRKTDNWTHGMISVMHTYGRDMKWNPHIHALVAERVYDKYHKHYAYNYFHFNSLRRIYKYKLINSMSQYLKSIKSPHLTRFIKASKVVDKKYPDGFYTYGPDIDDYTEDGKTLSAKAVAEYIARYASHPAIAESRIVDIDYDKHTVTWIYDPHEDDKKADDEKLGTQTITEHVFSFMQRLIIHIPDKGFHLIRYQGFYANHSTIQTQDYKRLYPKYVLSNLKQNIKWERMLILNFKYTPLLCECGGQMTLSLTSSFLPRNRGPTYEN